MAEEVKEQQSPATPENLQQETQDTTAENLESSVQETNEIEKIQAEVALWKDKYVRLVAEFDNYKKRSFKEKMDVIQTAGKDIMLSLLEVIDDSERAEKLIQNASDIESVKSGIQLIINKLNTTVSSKGLKSFSSIGEEFDVEKHEAITEIPAPTPEMAGKVVDEIVKGYYMNDKLIRHAKVVVGKSTEN